MKYINIINIVIFLALFISCSNKQQAANSDQKEATLYSLTTYRNIYNEFGKLDTVFIDKKRYSMTGSTSSQELHLSYKNDTILSKEEEYEIQWDGSKVLKSLCLYEENIEKYFRFNNDDTIVQINSLYKDGNIISQRTIDVREYSMENSEIIFSYDSINRISQIKTIDYNNGTTINEIYKYDVTNDTLITYIYVDNVLKNTEKKIEQNDYSIELLYNDQGQLEVLTKVAQIDAENKVSAIISNALNRMESNFYVSGKIVKTITRPFENKPDKAINIDDIDKNKGYTLEDLIDAFAGSRSIETILYEYDEFGNIITEAQYEESDVD
jgi:hypothetical protein